MTVCLAPIRCPPWPPSSPNARLRLTPPWRSWRPSPRLFDKIRPEYIFEAKPLNYEKTYQRTGNYTDKDEAIGRFLKGEYAEYTARFPEVAMLGYMHTDTAEIWRERLKKAIAIKGTELALRATQRDVTVITKFPMEWVSEHDRKSAPDCPIAIYHLLLHLPLPKASRLKAAPPRRQRTQHQDEGKTGNV